MRQRKSWHHKIDALQPQRRESDQRADNAVKRPREKNRPGRDVELLQIGGGIGADGEKAAWPNDACPVQPVRIISPTPTVGVDADEKDQLADEIAGDNKRRDQKQHQPERRRRRRSRVRNSLMSSS